jgi:hypothetical protein
MQNANADTKPARPMTPYGSRDLGPAASTKWQGQLKFSPKRRRWSAPR